MSLLLLSCTSIQKKTFQLQYWKSASGNVIYSYNLTLLGLVYTYCSRLIAALFKNLKFPRKKAHTHNAIFNLVFT